MTPKLILLQARASPRLSGYPKAPTTFAKCFQAAVRFTTMSLNGTKRTNPPHRALISTSECQKTGLTKMIVPEKSAIAFRLASLRRCSRWFHAVTSHACSAAIVPSLLASGSKFDAWRQREPTLSLYQLAQIDNASAKLLVCRSDAHARRWIDFERS